jgi:hypothetical protein
MCGGGAGGGVQLREVVDMMLVVGSLTFCLEPIVLLASLPEESHVLVSGGFGVP